VLCSCEHGHGPSGSLKVQNFFHSCVTISFLRSLLFHELLGFCGGYLNDYGTPTDCDFPRYSTGRFAYSYLYTSYLKVDS
jgi:hypothetical protein